MSTTTSRPAATPSSAGPVGPEAPVRNDRFRPDIQGMRAIACLLVLLYHAGLSVLPGGFVGVDVFFVISGFVITGQLLKEGDRTGTVSLLGFYARRAKRLLPAAGLVLVSTAVLVWAFVPKIRWETTGGDIVASSLYFVNWHLAARQVDYLAEDEPPSVVQHFWSLSVEEQFYFLWPLLFIVFLLVARRFGLARRLSLTLGLAVITVPSLAYAAHLALSDPTASYFNTGTRIWEFSAGAFVAIAAPWLDRAPARLAQLAGWVGLALVAGSGLFLNEKMTWPGAYTLVPVVGTALVLAAGPAAGALGPVVVLRNGFMQQVGNMSYSLYLWHWPLLTVARAHYGDKEITTPIGVLILLVCAVPAYLSYRFVENPIRHSARISRSKRTAAGVGAFFTAIGVVAGLLLSSAVSASARNVADTPGAAILGDPPATSVLAGQGPGSEDYAAIYPDPLVAAKDLPDLYAAGCQVDQDTDEPKVCEYGPQDAKTTIAVVGDSKAAQWVPAFQQLADAHDWRIRTYTKSACAFATITTINDKQPYTSCRTWTDNVLKDLTGANKPDYVVTVSLKSTGIDGTKADGSPRLSKDAMVAALADTWGRLEQAGVKVISLSDTPQTQGKAIYECVSEHEGDYFTACTYDRAKGIDASGQSTQEAAARKADVPFIDMNDFICPTAYDGRCPPVIGNVMIYRQGSHITRTYIETMAQPFYEELRKAGVPG
ncbi:acyltransferase [Nocardioides sp. TRM66260-LWL]|uniref:acyltransferase family protein n=1 Tax=Nocardioides sp. TRM66260-LWL TaxID=2874478 RepID=UPI001CC5F301|nr:acyltransferase family protein [Nocardioides sp. TRM66260-LWL]MBZ5735508.1 acyltransferase [Nocardioides sp. TRM66260-LWL]